MDQFIDTPGPSGTSQAIDLTESQPLDLTSGSLASEQPKKRRRGMTEADCDGWCHMVDTDVVSAKGVGFS
jgi:hypothetical protein